APFPLELEDRRRHGYREAAVPPHADLDAVAQAVDRVREPAEGRGVVVEAVDPPLRVGPEEVRRVRPDDHLRLGGRAGLLRVLSLVPPRARGIRGTAHAAGSRPSTRMVPPSSRT